MEGIQAGSLKRSLEARIPELSFRDDHFAENLAIDIALSLDGKATQIHDVGMKPGNHLTYKNGHIIRTAGDKLRWTGITIENGISKYDFVADFTVRGGKLNVEYFQLNLFALGVKVLPTDDATDYLNEYMEESNDWHVGYMVSSGQKDKFHPSNVLLIPDEGDDAAVKRLEVVPVSPALLKFLRQTEDRRLEPLTARRGETIHGIMWLKNEQTDQQFYPMILYHKLRVQKPTRLAGYAERVLWANFCDCHEPGSVDIAQCVDDLREDSEAVFVAYTEDVVLHFFHRLTADEGDASYGKSLDQEPAVVLPN